MHIHNWRPVIVNVRDLARMAAGWYACDGKPCERFLAPDGRELREYQAWFELTLQLRRS